MRSNSSRWAALVALAAGCCYSAIAVAQTGIGVANHSFEAPALAPVGFTGSMVAWTDGDGAGNNVGIFRPGAGQFPGGVTQGVNTAFTNSSFFLQTLAETLQADTQYTLTVDVGARADSPNPGYLVELRAGGTTLASANQIALPPPAGGFVTANLQFLAPQGHANLGQNLEVFVSRGVGGTGQPNFDNVTLTKSFMGTINGGAGNFINVVNPSFELDNLADGGFANTITGWTQTGAANSGPFNPTNAQYVGATGVDGPIGGVPDGANVAFSNGQTISQVLGDVLEAGKIYTLQVDVGRRLDGATPIDYAVQLLAGGVLLAEEDLLNPAPGTFETSLITFTGDFNSPQLGQQLEIRLLNNSTTAQVNFDNVRLFQSAQVPEPASLAVWGLVAIIGGIVAYRRRR